MSSKLIKGNINLKGVLRNSIKGDVIYLEPSSLVVFDKLMKQVSSYASSLNMKIKQTAFKGLSNNDEIIKICRVEVLTIASK